MRTAIVSGFCLAAAFALAPSGPALAQTAVAIACKAQQTVLPTKQVDVTWEDRGMCSAHANATKKAADGKKLSASDTKRIDLMAWLDANLDAGDKLSIDRFGRATLIRCSSDPNAQMLPKPAPKIGDGTYELYILLELPPGAGGCPAAS